MSLEHLLPSRNPSVARAHAPVKAMNQKMLSQPTLSLLSEAPPQGTSEAPHPGGNPGANLKSVSHRRTLCRPGTRSERDAQIEGKVGGPFQVGALGLCRPPPGGSGPTPQIRSLGGRAISIERVKVIHPNTKPLHSWTLPVAPRRCGPDSPETGPRGFPGGGAFSYGRGTPEVFRVLAEGGGSRFRAWV